ncbi:hypothetical protein Tco_0331804, partial [Tanacetum coccineum]
MAAISNVPQLVDTKGDSSSSVAPRLEPEKVNKWKKCMLCFLTGMECIKDGPFKPKTAEGANKPESQWTPDERRVVNQDQRLKSIIISCLPDDIMESVISFSLRNGSASPNDLEMQTILKPLNLLISMKDSPISTAFFSNNIVQDFQENYNDKADKRTSEEYLRDLDIEFHERALLANSKRFIKRKNKFSVQKANNDIELLRGFQYKFPPKFIQSTQHAQSSLGEPKDEEEVSEDEEEKIDQVLMALADDELSVGKNHARNGEWIDITMKK